MGDDGFRSHDHGTIEVMLFLVVQRGGTVVQTLLQVVHHPAQALVESLGVVGNAGAGSHAHVVVIHARLGVLSRIHTVLVLVHLVVEGNAGAVLPLLVHLFQQLFRLLGNLHFTKGSHLGKLHFILDPGHVPLGIRIHAAAYARKRADDGIAVKKYLLGQKNALKQLRPDIERGFAGKFVIHVQKAAKPLGIHDLRGGHQKILQLLNALFGGIPVDAFTLPFHGGRRSELHDRHEGSPVGKFYGDWKKMFACCRT